MSRTTREPETSISVDADAGAPTPSKLSPAMAQYQKFKAQHPGYVLFFRMGDFYEMFWEDAQLASRVLGVALTARSKGPDAIPMAGVPFHAVESYLRKMIAAGHKVAICEQVEDPALAKGVIQREVVRLMTPGTLTDEPLLEGRTDNYLAAVAFAITKSHGYRAALAWVELSTGNCHAMSGSEAQLLDEICRLAPAEVLIPELPSGQPHDIGKRLAARQIRGITQRPGWHFTPHHAGQCIREQWQTAGVAGFGFDADDPAPLATAAILTYLRETQKTGLSHIKPLRRHSVEDHFAIDPASWRALEVDRTVRAGTAQGSLLCAIDRTRTAMGARLLAQWLRTPLCDLNHIAARHSAVEALLESSAALTAVVKTLEDICDIERIMGRLAVGRAQTRDLASLARCLERLPMLFDKLAAMERVDDVAPELLSMRRFCQERCTYLASAIHPQPAPHLREGGVIADGFDPELDRLRGLATNSQQWLAEYQTQLAAQSRIPSLRISYNKVFGYYIEVTESHKDKVPADWIRRQTVRNAERYITPELKTFEEQALGARDKAIALEQQLFEAVRQELLPHMATLQELAASIARLDVLAGFAVLAAERRYCKPELSDRRGIDLVDARHPVLEQQLGSEFVANDLHIADDDALLLITGPNMAGKSTYIRQTALITLMAQIGSYVPAKSASLGIADRLFARIGASDEIHGGQSTFMVEMTETANILNNATDRSLVVLDEIGRGTSTLDGLSLAWAICEHLAGHVRPRVLFATHYHELTDLAQRFHGVRNLNVAVREWEDQVIFLHRIVEGGTDRSYGIHVARLAGVPPEVLKRARQLLGELAVQHIGQPTLAPTLARHKKKIDDWQLSLFTDPGAALLKSLASLNVSDLTPEAARALLAEWKAKFS